MGQNRTLLFISIFLMFAGLARAEKLDLSAHDAIIQKLESAANVRGDDSMVQTIPLNHRLADLYAERARLLSQENEGKGAATYAAEIKTDRKKAILLLEQILPELPKNEKGTALLQSAHLHELLSENEEALKIYERIEKTPQDFDSKTNALIEIKLGDNAFAKNDLARSQKHFEKSLTYSENPRKAYVHYRLAWVYFNQGETLEAQNKLLTLLQTPKLYTNAAGETDEAFVDEATHDLATFLARNSLPKESLKSYVKVTPKRLLQKNLIYLAQELDRTAKKGSALKVLALVGTQKLSLEDQVEKQIQVTRIEYDLGHSEAVIQELTKSLALLQNSKCHDNSVCTLAQQNLRKMITDWARAEDRTVSPTLMLALNKYTDAFPDYEINIWAAGLAQKKNQHQTAFRFYLRTSTLLKEVNPKNDQQKKLFEQSLVGAIEMAEFAKDPTAKLQAYQRYLEFNPNGAQKSEVKYEIARWSYDQNDYLTARESFRKLSLDSSLTMSLREKSADLCLDTSVLLKDEPRLEKDSLELAGILKNRKTEFMAIYRKSILNQTAKMLNANPTDPELEAELKKLNRIDGAAFSADEKKQFLKNQMEIAYRLKDVNRLTMFANQFLNLKNTKSVDQQKSFQYLAWATEIRMNFKETLRYMKNIQPTAKEQSSYDLKVALLKELSSQNPTTNYEKFLAVSKDPAKRAFAAHQIVVHSQNPLTAFNKYEVVLRKSKDLYPSAALFVFEKNQDAEFAEHALAQPAFKGSNEAQLLRHQNTLAEFKKLAQLLNRSHFKAGSDAQIKKSLVQRNELIRQLEKTTNRSIAKKDTVEQIILLPKLAIENQRLANDILTLPQPKHLSKNEKRQYTDQLNAMVAPYQKQSLAIINKVKELWTQQTTQDLFNDLADWATQINRPGHTLALQELSLLRASVQSLGLDSRAFEKLSERRQKVSNNLTEASSLQTKIAQSPFDFSYLEKMKSVQQSLGSGPMVAYLDSRINELNSRGR